MSELASEPFNAAASARGAGERSELVPRVGIGHMEDLVALRVSLDDHVAEVTLLGPGKGNAMGPDFWRELPLVFHALNADPDVRAVVLTGSNGHFSYGIDLPAMTPGWVELLSDHALAESRTHFLDELRTLQSSVNSIADCRKPVIAAISGWCIGAGMDVVAAADIRLTSVEAKFSVRETRMAIVADLGSLQRLSGIVGEGHLRELAYTGKDIDAARAERIGLVNDVYPNPEAVLTGARELAAEIAANPPLVVQGVKEVLALNHGPRIEAGLRYVGAWNSAFLPSEDLLEAFQAFKEHRDPRFSGR